MADNLNLPVASVQIVVPNSWLVTDYWRRFFEFVWNRVNGTIESGWDNPTGTGSRATFDMDAAFPVSNPPTQAEVQAIAAQLVIVQKRLGQLIDDQLSAKTIG